MELSGLPVYDRVAKFRRLSRLWRLPRSRRPGAAGGARRVESSADRRAAALRPTSLRPVLPRTRPPQTCPPYPARRRSTPEPPAPIAVETSHQTDLETARGNADGNPRTSCRFARSASRNRRPDAGGKQRLQRARPAIVGAARQRERRGHRNAGRIRCAPTRLPSRRPRWKPPGPANNRLAGAARAARARRNPARQDAARPAAGRRADLPARPAALCQPRVSRADRLSRACTRWRRPAVSTRSMSSPASRPPAARRTPARR